MISYGAITVINAIPCGIGATVGIRLRTNAEFRASGSERKVNIVNEPDEDTAMARICVKNVFEYFHLNEPEGWSLSVDSEIPVSRGLKSSSSACNAVISAVSAWTAEEHGKGFGASFDETVEMIRLGVRCAKEANVTVTGAFDDACGCHLGGLVITDNGKNIILEHRKADEKDVILLIPEEKIRKPSLPKEKLYGVADAVRRLVPRTKDDWCDALTKNGHIVAEALGLDDRIAGKAMSLGALAAGVSGTGPAVSVVVGKGEGRSFLKELEHGGYSAIITGTR